MAKNVLFITSDQQHWNTLGVLNPEIQTPNLDKLAARGALFERAYTVNPTCTPTRASWITGLYPSQHGAWSLGTALPQDVPTIGDSMASNNMSCELIGKAHFQPLASTPDHPSLEAYPVLQDLEFWKTYTKKFYGFNHYELARNHTNEAHVGQHYALWMEEKGCKNWREYFLAPTGTMDETIRHTWPLPEEFHYDTWIAERTCARLDAHKNTDTPFFLWASFFDPHPDYLVPEPWASMYDPATITLPPSHPGEHEDSPPHIQKTQELHPDFSSYKETGKQIHGFHCHREEEENLRKDMAIYYGMVSMMDHYIGKILDRLEENGQSEDTLVVFTTDHGHYLGHHNLTAKGAFHYDDGIKVPFIAACPNLIPQGVKSSQLLSLIDLAPTFLAIMGIQAPRTMAGKDMTPLLTNPSQPFRNRVICENQHEPTTVNLRTYIDSRYKITVYYDREYGELYDLQTDPGELTNLWDHPESQGVKNQLLLSALSAEMDKAPLPMDRVAEA